MARQGTLALMTFISLALVGHSTEESITKQIRIDIISLGYFSLNTAPSLWQAEPVFAAGIDYLTLQYPQFTWTYQSVTDPIVKNCLDEHENIQFILARWYYTRSTTNATSLPIIITFGCEDATELNMLAAAWNVLLITGLDFKPNMQNRRLFPTYLTSAEITPPLSDLYCDLFRTMKWTKLYMLFDRNSSDYYRGRDRNILKSFKETCPVTLQVTRNEFSRHDNDTFIMSKLWEFNARSRVLMFLGDSEGLRKVMVVASLLNMTHGEHVYLAVLPFESEMFGNPLLWQPSSTDDETIQKAYQAVVLMRLVDDARYKAPAMQKFIQKWLANPGPDKQLRNKLPNLVSIHIGIELAGIAINETYTPQMQSQGLLPGGRDLANSLLNRTFELAVGQTPVMASAQVRHRHFVSSYDILTREYHIFLQTIIDPVTYTYQWNHVIGGQWFGKTVFPPDTPSCGFDGKADACQTFSKRERPIIIGGGCLIVLCLVVVVYVKMKQTHALNDDWWEILAEDIKKVKKSSAIFMYKLHQLYEKERDHSLYEKDNSQYSTQLNRQR